MSLYQIHFPYMLSEQKYVQLMMGWLILIVSCELRLLLCIIAQSSYIVRLAACAHPGPCTSNICPCYVEKQHCTLMCRCGVKCKYAISWISFQLDYHFY